MVYNTFLPAATAKGKGRSAIAKAQKWRNAMALLGDMKMLQVQVNVITKTSIMKAARLHGASSDQATPLWPWNFGLPFLDSRHLPYHFKLMFGTLLRTVGASGSHKVFTLFVSAVFRSNKHYGGLDFEVE